MDKYGKQSMCRKYANLKTAQRYGKNGLLFFRDPGGRPIAKPSMLLEFIVELKQEKYDDKTWRDEGIDTALGYEAYKEKKRKEFDERFILAQRPLRSWY
jgi:hypothetical protein